MHAPLRLPDAKSPSPRGSALIAVLWTVAVLSLAVFSATQFLLLELEAEANATSLFRAELLADRGIALAAHPDTGDGDSLLDQDFGAEGSFTARLGSEGARLPINALLLSPEADRIVLEELFHRWGLRRDEAAAAVDNLIDWVDEDDEPTGRGAERAHYAAMGRANHPFNRPFRSLEELLLVEEFDRVAAANPEWRDAFTLWSSGRLDLNEAPAELIAAACQCPPEAARLFVVLRDGPEGRSERERLRFDSVATVLDLLGVPPALAETVARRVALDDPVKRIDSVGRDGPIAVERSVTLHYTGGHARVLRSTSRRIE